MNKLEQYPYHRALSDITYWKSRAQRLEAVNAELLGALEAIKANSGWTNEGAKHSPIIKKALQAIAKAQGK